jgi:hypothetical protein
MMHLPRAFHFRGTGFPDNFDEPASVGSRCCWHNLTAAQVRRGGDTLGASATTI